MDCASASKRVVAIFRVLCVSAASIIWVSEFEEASEITSSSLSLAVSLSFVAGRPSVLEHVIVVAGQLAAFICKKNEPDYEPVVWATTAVVYNIAAGAMWYFCRGRSPHRV